MNPIKENLRVMLHWGWVLEQDQARLQANRESMRRRMSKDGVRLHFYSLLYDIPSICSIRKHCCLGIWSFEAY